MTLTILPPDADPLATLRTMAAFGMDEGRGIAEIKSAHVPVEERWEGSSRVPKLIGLAILNKSPEKAAIPIFDTATRTVEVTMLADWLKARGYEASACRWNRRGFTASEQAIKWVLLTGPAEVPAMPPLYGTHEIGAYVLNRRK